MIIFEQISYQNFLSTGNIPNVLQFNEYNNTIIVGENGDGKTTVIDALCYALYNKPFRNINRPQIINSVTEKNLLVELTFTVNTNQYRLCRGMKPNVFEIHKNGSLIEPPSDLKDYQTMLEKEILKMDYKTFIQIVIIGSTNYTPFMKLPLWNRREVVEDLLDIQIFSTMNSVLKDRVTENKNEISENEHKLDLILHQIELNNKHMKQLQVNNQEIIEAKNLKIKTLSETSIQLLAEVVELEERLEDEAMNLRVLSSTATKKNELDQLIRLADNKIRDVKKQIQFYESYTECSTCKQEITIQFKDEEIHHLLSNVSDLETGIIKLDDKRNLLIEELQEKTEIEERIANINRSISEKKTFSKSYARQIKELYDEIRDLEKKNKTIKVDDNINEALNDSLMEHQGIKKGLLESRELLSVASMLLKDGGIKATIIAHYMPVMNRLINKYLESIDFFLNFEFDSNFKESINSRYKGSYSYDSFSEGEKVRINLALLISWRDIARLRNSAACNLLFFDETLDGSLDDDGVEHFLTMINSLNPDTNVFVISHKKDQMLDKFQNVIKFKKQNNFSVMEKMT